MARRARKPLTGGAEDRFRVMRDDANAQRDEVWDALVSLRARKAQEEKAFQQWRDHLQEGRALVASHEPVLSGKDRDVAQQFLDIAEGHMESHAANASTFEEKVNSVKCVVQDLDSALKDIETAEQKLDVRKFLEESRAPGSASGTAISDERLSEISRRIKQAKYFARGLREIV